MPAEPTLGQIMPVAFYNPGNLPKGWHLCDGSLLPVAQNAALFSLLGTRFGGDGRTNFGLPDLRGRAVVGGAGDGSNVGVQAGATTVTLTDQQMPSHNHMWNASTAQGPSRGVASPKDNLFGVNTVGSPVEQVFAMAGSMELPLANGTNILPAGSSGAHNNMQPYLVINYMIAIAGIFPSRL